VAPDDKTLADQNKDRQTTILFMTMMGGPGGSRRASPLGGFFLRSVGWTKRSPEYPLV
jgi:hypothetical protein